MLWLHINDVVKFIVWICCIFFVQYIMELTFTQAAKGVNKEISINIDAACQRCDGKGHEPGTKVQHCHNCNGSGMVRAPAPSVFLQSVFVLFLSTPAVIPVGDCEHGSVCDAVYLSALWRERNNNLQPLPGLSRAGTDKTEEECDGSCPRWSVTLLSLLMLTHYYMGLGNSMKEGWIDRKGGRGWEWLYGIP